MASAYAERAAPSGCGGTRGVRGRWESQAELAASAVPPGAAGCFGKGPGEVQLGVTAHMTSQVHRSAAAGSRSSGGSSPRCWLDEPECVLDIEAAQERLPGPVHFFFGGRRAEDHSAYRVRVALAGQVIHGQPDEGALDDRQCAVVAFPAAAVFQPLGAAGARPSPSRCHSGLARSQRSPPGQAVHRLERELVHRAAGPSPASRPAGTEQVRRHTPCRCGRRLKDAGQIVAGPGGQVGHQAGSSPGSNDAGPRVACLPEPRTESAGNDSRPEPQVAACRSTMAAVSPRPSGPRPKAGPVRLTSPSAVRPVRSAVAAAAAPAGHSRPGGAPAQAGQRRCSRQRPRRARVPRAQRVRECRRAQPRK